MPNRPTRPDDIHTATTLPTHEAPPDELVREREALRAEYPDAPRYAIDLLTETRAVRRITAAVADEQQEHASILRDHTSMLSLHAGRLTLLEAQRGPVQQPRGRMASLTTETADDPALSVDDKVHRLEIETIKAKTGYVKQLGVIVIAVVSAFGGTTAVGAQWLASRLDRVQDAAKQGAVEGAKDAPPKVIPVAVPVPQEHMP